MALRPPTALTNSILYAYETAWESWRSIHDPVETACSGRGPLKKVWSGMVQGAGLRAPEGLTV